MMRKWKIGDVTITKIVESELSHGLEFLIAPATPEAVLPLNWPMRPLVKLYSVPALS